MARTQDVWETGGIDGTYIKTTSVDGYDILINGTDRYLNFNTTVGVSGYGFRDNNGTIQWRNFGGAWADIGSGGGGTPGGSDTQLQYNNEGAFGGISGATTNGTSVTYTTSNLLGADIKASSSAGLQILSNAGTVTALFGAGSGANSTFYGGSKFDYATATTVPYFDASKNLISSAVTPTELGYLSGVTSAIQTQLNAKFTLPSLTAGSVLFSDGSTIAQDNANFRWDNTLKALRIGGTSSSIGGDVDLAITKSGTASFSIQNSDTGAEILMYVSGTTGLITSGTGDLALGAEGDQVLTINNSGITTIGLTTPLTINTTGAITSATGIASSGTINFSGLTASKLVFTDASKNLTSTGIGTSSQFIKGDGSLDSSTYLTANQTITLSGDITGSGATSITTTISAGAVDIAMLSATGTPSSSTYLRGDNTWATISAGGVSGSGTTNELAYWTGASSLGTLAVATYPSLTELSYVKGVTSAIQTQLNAKFTLPALTSGSVLFSNGTTIAQDNANFFYNDTNNALGIGTNTPETLISNLSASATKLGLYNSASGTDFVLSGNGYARMFFNDTSGGVNAKLYEMLNYQGELLFSRLNDSNTSRSTRLGFTTGGQPFIPYLGGSGTRLVTTDNTGYLTGSTLGTGVQTALAVNVGTAGAFIVNGGALGTPSGGTLTNATGLPIAGLVSSTSTALGVGSLELGHASDTTLSRASAGILAVEGKEVLTTDTGIKRISRTLTATEIIDGQTTPITLISAPGSGFIIVVTGIDFFFNYSSAFTGSGTPFFDYGTDTSYPVAFIGTDSGTLSSFTESTFFQGIGNGVLGYIPYPYTAVENEAVTFHRSGVNTLAGGSGSTLTVTLTYYIQSV